MYANSSMRLRNFGQNDEDAVVCCFFDKPHDFDVDISPLDGVVLSFSNPERISSRIVNEIVAANSVVLEGTSNPPRRIAWK